MLRFLLLISLFFAAEASFAKSPYTCPVDPIGNIRKIAVHDYKINQQDTIVICVFPEFTEDGNLKNKYLTQYDANLYRGGKWVRKVLSGTGNTPVQFQLRQGQLFEVMHLNFRGEYFPLYKEKIECKGDQCTRSDKKCVFQQHKVGPFHTEDYAREKDIYSKATAKVQEMSEADLAEMTALALYGRKLANAFFTMEPAPIMMGRTANFYKQMQGLLQKMQDEGCLKVDTK